MGTGITTAAIIMGLLIAACGGTDAIDDAENCTELAAAIVEIGDLSDDQKERAGDKAVDLGGKAAANGADVEFLLCGTVAIELEAQEVEQIFDDIAEDLSSP